MLKLTQKAKPEKPEAQSNQQDQIDLKDQLKDQEKPSKTAFVDPHTVIVDPHSGAPQKQITNEETEKHAHQWGPTKAMWESTEKNRSEPDLMLVDPHIAINKVGPHKLKDRHLKKSIKVRYNDEMLDEIKKYCEKSKLTVQEFHERLVVNHFLKVGPHIVHKVGPHTESGAPQKQSMWGTHDDLMISNWIDDNIINLYRKITGKNWDAQDERLITRIRKEVKKCWEYDIDKPDLKIVELGILNTYFNVLNGRGQKIESFAYFIPEIVKSYALRGAEALTPALSSTRRMVNKLLAEKGKKPLSDK